jgi:predicted metal-dependent HD superfamily phosphohydrolase
MKPISDALLDALETEATEWVRQLSALRAYQGEDRRYYEKGKLAVGIISGLARMRASESNRMAVELASGRVEPLAPAKQIEAGRGKRG